MVRPDITVMVDWALKINYLSIHPPDGIQPLPSVRAVIHTPSRVSHRREGRSRHVLFLCAANFRINLYGHTFTHGQ